MASSHQHHLRACSSTNSHRRTATTVAAIAIFVLGVCTYVFIDETTLQRQQQKSSYYYLSKSKSKSTLSSSSSQSMSTSSRDVYEQIRQHQIDNNKLGSSLMLNFHPTHHGGTTFCGIIGHNSQINPEDKTPNFACWKDNDDTMNINNESDYYNTKYLDTAPWEYNVTAYNIQQIRQYFHMISWEYHGIHQMSEQHKLENTHLLHPNLLSVFVTRHPLSRLLADGGTTATKYPGYNKGQLSHDGWWHYAAYDSYAGTDNFVLRMIGNFPQPKHHNKAHHEKELETKLNQQQEKEVTNNNKVYFYEKECH